MVHRLLRLSLGGAARLVRGLELALGRGLGRASAGLPPRSLARTGTGVGAGAGAAGGDSVSVPGAARDGPSWRARFRGPRATGGVRASDVG